MPNPIKITDLLDELERHHDITVNAQARYALRPDTPTGQRELERAETRNKLFHEVIAEIRRLAAESEANNETTAKTFERLRARYAERRRPTLAAG